MVEWLIGGEARAGAADRGWIIEEILVIELVVPLPVCNVRDGIVIGWFDDGFDDNNEVASPLGLTAVAVVDFKSD